MLLRCLSGSEGGEAGKTEAKERREAVGTLIPPAEATDIPVDTQDCFTSKHCCNGLMDFFFPFNQVTGQVHSSVACSHSLTNLFGTGALGDTNSHRRFGLGEPGV